MGVDEDVLATMDDGDGVDVVVAVVVVGAVVGEEAAAVWALVCDEPEGVPVVLL